MKYLPVYSLISLFFINFAQEEKKIMTNREIKLELAKVALSRLCCCNSHDEVLEVSKTLYDWIMEEPEAEVETTDNNSLDSIDIKEIIHIIRKNRGYSSTIPASLDSTFSENNINTIGDLIHIGRRDFFKYRLVGKCSIWAIDDALDELGIKGW